MASVVFVRMLTVPLSEFSPLKISVPPPETVIPLSPTKTMLNDA
jgi:hypothetical protein